MMKGMISRKDQILRVFRGRKWRNFGLFLVCVNWVGSELKMGELG